eukprot:5295659-Amphidinium_carterae.1
MRISTGRGRRKGQHRLRCDPLWASQTRTATSLWQSDNKWQSLGVNCRLLQPVQESRPCGRRARSGRVGRCSSQCASTIICVWKNSYFEVGCIPMATPAESEE